MPDHIRSHRCLFKMRLGLVLWWATVGVVGRAWHPTGGRPQDALHTDESSSVSPSESPAGDADDIGFLGTQAELVHAEELLEKYGYLWCVPPGSEQNTHLHRLLLYRLDHTYTQQPLLPNTPHHQSGWSRRLSGRNRRHEEEWERSRRNEETGKSLGHGEEWERSRRNEEIGKSLGHEEEWERSRRNEETGKSLGREEEWERSRRNEEIGKSLGHEEEWERSRRNEETGRSLRHEEEWERSRKQEEDWTRSRRNGESGKSLGHEEEWERSRRNGENGRSLRHEEEWERSRKHEGDWTKSRRNGESGKSLGHEEEWERSRRNGESGKSLGYEEEWERSRRNGKSGKSLWHEEEWERSRKHEGELKNHRLSPRGRRHEDSRPKGRRHKSKRKGHRKDIDKGQGEGKGQAIKIWWENIPNMQKGENKEQKGIERQEKKMDERKKGEFKEVEIEQKGTEHWWGAEKNDEERLKKNTENMQKGELKEQKEVDKEQKETENRRKAEDKEQKTEQQTTETKQEGDNNGKEITKQQKKIESEQEEMKRKNMLKKQNNEEKWQKAGVGEQNDELEKGQKAEFEEQKEIKKEQKNTEREQNKIKTWQKSAEKKETEIEKWQKSKENEEKRQKIAKREQKQIEKWKKSAEKEENEIEKLQKNTERKQNEFKSQNEDLGTQEDERDMLSVWDPESEQIRHLPICSKKDIQDAVRKFQEMYHVGGDGRLDGRTINLLSRPRCGNPDTVEGVTGGIIQGTHTLTRRRRRRRSTRGSLGSGRGSAGLIDEGMLERFAEEIRFATQASFPSLIQLIEDDTHHKEGEIRRRRWLEDQTYRVRTGEEDVNIATLINATTRGNKTHIRNKRSNFNPLHFFSDIMVITWRLVTSGYSSQLDVGAQRASLALAFRMWSEVIPPIFMEDTINPTSAVDISIGFGKRSHLGCLTDFDGLGGDLGHTLRPEHNAQIHMDDDEHFTLNSEHGTNLLKVAVHEIGHVLGLGHVTKHDSVMQPVYEKILPNQGLELSKEDRKMVQRIYGPCEGEFNTVFDFLRWRSDGSLTYNTFFFRKDHYWMYENKYNRTRYGDPLKVTPEWGGLPTNVDGYAHIWTRTKDVHLFFKGDKYYVYDSRVGRVLGGSPRRIDQDFHGPPTAKRPKGKTIPNKIDTVYFDKRDENLYFFKGKKVWGYDVSKGTSGCCLPGYPKRIRDEFKLADPNKGRRLPRSLDAAYYSYTHQTLFFLKDRLYWEVSSFHPHDRSRNNSVVGPFKVKNKWHDICDTELGPNDA